MASGLTKMKMKRGLQPKFRKMYKGQIYYFRADNEREAIRLWEAKKFELDNPQRLAPLSPSERLGAMAKTHEVEAWSLRAFANAGDEFAEIALAAIETEPTTAKTIGQAIEQFKTRQALRVSVSQQENYRRTLEHFGEFVGKRHSVQAINGQSLDAYHSLILGNLKKGWSNAYADLYCRNVKTFVRWAWKTDLLDKLPKSIDDVSVSTPAKKIKTFTADEVRTLLGKAPERLKLGLLLMLNTGMTQKDCSDLKPSEIDWKAGTITRKRSKTQDEENTPEVCYPLWKETFDLLKKLGHRTGERALTNRDGQPLLQERIVAGKYKKKDNLRGQFDYLCRKKLAGAINKSLKVFRKTSSSMLNKNSEFARFGQFFLAHAPGSVAEKHYIAPDDASFVRAVNWLGEQFGIR